MRIINSFKRLDPQAFVYQPAKELHPHDRFLEKTILRFLPAAVTPNKLTITRIVLTPCVFFLILHGFYRSGFWLFIFAAFTDALDGSMARTKNMITGFGKLFDPLADKLLVGSMILLLVFKYFHPLLGVALLGLEIIFIMYASVIKIKFKTEVAANRWGKIKMALQVIAMSLTMLALAVNNPVLLTVAAWLFGTAIGFALLSLFKGGV